MVCVVEKCEDNAVGKGFCKLHWQRNRDGTDMSKPRPVLHGRSGTVEHRIWKNIKSRCYNKNVPCYPDYGGRGIRVCDRWKNSFTDFLADMGELPKGKHSIDRIDNDGNYEPKNCRWATWHEQALNRRKRSTEPYNKILRDKDRLEIAREYKTLGAEALAKKYSVAVGTIKNVYWNRNKSSV